MVIKGQTLPATRATDKLLSTADYNINQRKHVVLFVRFLPLIFFSLYLTFTVSVFAFGPWMWPIQNGFELYTFLFFNQVALAVGYTLGALRRPRKYYWRWGYQRLLNVSLFFNLLLLLPTALSRTGSWIPNVVEGLRNPGIVYYLANARQADGGNVVEYLRILLSPLLVLYFPLAVFYWQKIGQKQKWWVALVVLWTAAIWISIGTNKGLADYVLLIPWFVFSSFLAKEFRLRKSTKILFTGLFISFLIGFFFFFTAGNMQRTGGGIFYLETPNVAANENHPLLQNVPNNIKVGITSLSAYISQGYYGLSLSMQQPFLPMFGVGNSFFFYRNTARLLQNPDIEYRPYPARLEKDGWSATVNWSSIYPWIASDVSFPGTIFVVFVIGYLFARSWLETVVSRNPFALVLYGQFSLMLFYFSANNQVLQTGEGAIAFISILIVWAISRRAIKHNGGQRNAATY